MSIWPLWERRKAWMETVHAKDEFSIILPCGFKFGETIVRCSSTSCAICNPMTRERAAQINQRYFQEKGYDQPND